MFRKTINHLINPTNNAISVRVFRRLISVSVESDKFVVVQQHADGAGVATSVQEPLKFPSVWLRDNCYCPQCFHPTSKSRKHDWDKFDINVRVEKLQTNDETKQLIVDWSDNHQSVYDLKWLKERAFVDERRREYLDNFYRPKKKHWSGADFDKITETFEYKDILNVDEALKNWLEALSIRGVAIIKNAPVEKPVVQQLGERVGFIRRTTYGQQFIIESKPDTKNLAFRTDHLPLHTDLPYYEYKPNCTILHYMVQSNSKGGSNLLVDAFYIADRLKAEYPDDYKILTETSVDWNDIFTDDDGKEYHNIWRAPVICLDNEGNYTRINHNIPQRDSHFSVPLNNVVPWYKAYEKFVRLAREDMHAFKAKAGDVLTITNTRLLHGRTAYDDSEENVRYVVGGFIDWDIIYSKLRLLKTKGN